MSIRFQDLPENEKITKTNVYLSQIVNFQRIVLTFSKKGVFVTTVSPTTTSPISGENAVKLNFARNLFVCLSNGRYFDVFPRKSPVGQKCVISAQIFICGVRHMWNCLSMSPRQTWTYLSAHCILLATNGQHMSQCPNVYVICESLAKHPFWIKMSVFSGQKLSQNFVTQFLSGPQVKAMAKSSLLSSS